MTHSIYIAGRIQLRRHSIQLDLRDFLPSLHCFQFCFDLLEGLGHRFQRFLHSIQLVLQTDGSRQNGSHRQQPQQKWCDISPAATYEALAFATCFGTEDQKDAMKAFVEKKKLDGFKNR